MIQSLAQRMNLKSGYNVLLLNPPRGFALDELPDGATLTTNPDAIPENTYDAVLLFVNNSADIDAKTPNAWRSVKADGLFWVAYPKKSGAIKTNINRDVGWEMIGQLGLSGVKQISIDTTWSALRFRPVEAIKRPVKASEAPLKVE
ncbi:MAG: hypothetical protein SGI73_02115 [Chloroflexota bacterium]|nr:hypothetical protein [Chloroflexota bacterium]